MHWPMECKRVCILKTLAAHANALITCHIQYAIVAPGSLLSGYAVVGSLLSAEYHPVGH